MFKTINILALIVSILASILPPGTVLADDPDTEPPVIYVYHNAYGGYIEEGVVFEVPINALQYQGSTTDTEGRYIGDGILNIQSYCDDDTGVAGMTVSGGSDGYDNGTVDITHVGSYTVTFTCTDTSDNVTTRDLVVEVVPSDVSVVTYGGNYGLEPNISHDSQGNLYLSHSSIIRILPNGDEEITVSPSDYCWNPYGFMIDKNDNMYFRCQNRVMKFLPDGTPDPAWSTEPYEDDLWFDSVILGEDNHIYASIYVEGVYLITKTDENGNWSVVPDLEDVLSVDTDGNIYALYMYTSTFSKIDQNGNILWETDLYPEDSDVIENTYPEPKLFLDNNGNIFVVSQEYSRETWSDVGKITKVSQDGVILGKYYVESAIGFVEITPLVWAFDRVTGDVYTLNPVDNTLHKTTSDGHSQLIMDFNDHGWLREMIVGTDGNLYLWGEWAEASFAVWKLTLPTPSTPTLPETPQTPTPPTTGPGGATASPPVGSSNTSNTNTSNTGTNPSSVPVVPFPSVPLDSFDPLSSIDQLLLLSSAPDAPDPSSTSSLSSTSSAPTSGSSLIARQCRDEIKNLDTPELLEYYNILQILERNNTERRLTRAEFLKLILHSLKVSLGTENTATQQFSDLDQKSWYIPYFNYAVLQNMMKGQTLEDTHTQVMRPNDIISRQEVAKILTNTIPGSNDHLQQKENINTFSDIDTNSSLAPYIQYTYDHCILHGRETLDGEPLGGLPRVFEPNDGITLAETVKVLYNLAHTTN